MSSTAAVTVAEVAAFDSRIQLARDRLLEKDRLLPVVPALQSLLPDSGLRRGSTVHLEAESAGVSLAAALAASASAAGSWVTFLGGPEFAMSAAAEMGVVLDRVATIEPIADVSVWAKVAGAIVEAVDIAIVRAPQGLRRADAARLAARARRRGGVLVVAGDWPESADIRLAVENRRWCGLLAGGGYLRERLVDVVATGRGSASRPRRATLWLPAADGSVRPALRRIG